MNASHSISRRDVLVLRWAARALSFALFLLWGAFFVEHLWEWFTDPANLPPPFVFVMQALHGLFLLGLLVGWRWELLGAGMILSAAVPFFWFAAGANFLLFTAATSLPAILWLYCGRMEALTSGRRRNAGGDPIDPRLLPYGIVCAACENGCHRVHMPAAGIETE